jgi:hypothetical protein
MEPVQGRRTILVQDFEDRLVVGRRQRSLDGDLQPDRLRDLGGCDAESSSLENLGEQASNGSVEPDACNPHVSDVIGLPQALRQAAPLLCQPARAIDVTTGGTRATHERTEVVTDRHDAPSRLETAPEPGHVCNDHAFAGSDTVLPDRRFGPAWIRTRDRRIMSPLL